MASGGCLVKRVSLSLRLSLSLCVSMCFYVSLCVLLSLSVCVSLVYLCLYQPGCVYSFLSFGQQIRSRHHHFHSTKYLFQVQSVLGYDAVNQRPADKALDVYITSDPVPLTLGGDNSLSLPKNATSAWSNNLQAGQQYILRHQVGRRTVCIDLEWKKKKTWT